MSTNLRTLDPAAKYGKTPANDKSEAVAEANAYLNNHALPNVHALASQLKGLVDLVEAMTRSAQAGAYWEHDQRVARAKQSLRDLNGLTGGNI